MTSYISANILKSTHSESMYEFFTFITDSSQAGWACVGSGDGISSYQQGSSVFTSGSSGALGLNNANAWFAIGSPDQSRFLLFQRLASGSDWKITYSRSDFDYTSASNSVAPSIPQNAVNSNNDGSQIFNGTLFPQSEGNCRFNICANDSSDMSFYFFAYENTALTSGATTMFIFDVLSSSAIATGDNDPCVVYANANLLPTHANDGVLFNGRIHKSANQAGSNSFWGFVCHNALSPAQQFLKMTVSTYGSYSLANRSDLNFAPNNPLTNPYDLNSDESLPVYYFHLKTSPDQYDSFKGGSSLMLYGNKSRNVGDVLEFTSQSGATEYKIFINGFLFPWDGTVLNP